MHTQTPKQAEANTNEHNIYSTYPAPIASSRLLTDSNDNKEHYNNRKQQQGVEASAPILAAAARMGVLGEWQRGPVIGRGASATVSIATDRLTGDVFAVKSVEIARAGVLRRELSVLSALSSPYVVSCVGSDVSAAGDGSGAMFYDLFLEFAPGGSLADEIKRCGGRCEEPLIRSRAGDILRGLAYVHGVGIAHCDVKGRNVLVGADGRAKLADFGCARWTAEDSNAGGATIMGTPMFLAPEAARGEAQGTAADIWALGCTVLEMATGGAPWPRFADPVATLHHVAHSSDVPEAPACFSDEGKDFLVRCLMRDPTERWTAEQLLEHPFVASSQANSTSKAAPIEQWVSPKSILDQGFWEDSSTDADTTVAPTPADRVRALGAGSAPDWTWSGDDWITVCGLSSSNDTTLSPKSDAGTTDAGSSGGDEEHNSSSPGGERTGVDAPRGHGSSHGRHGGSAHGDAGSSCSSCRGKSVISGCNNNSCGNFASTSDGCCLLIKSVNFCPSWQLFTFPRAVSFLFLFTFPAASFPSRARREP